MMNEAFESVSILGFRVFSDNLLKIPIQGHQSRVINCSISPNGYGLAVKDPEFKEALKKTDYLVLDGVYFALASICLKGRNIKKNQGPEVFRHFIKRLDKTSGKAFFLGSSEDVLEKIKEKARIEYPSVLVETFSPPFKKEFSREDNREMISKINAFQPNVVFVGMTAPKQEKWSLRNKDELDCNLIISIGNVFDWYAGTQKEINPIWFQLRLAWLIRIFYRPEIFRRNIGNQMLFFWHLILMILKIKKQSTV